MGSSVAFVYSLVVAGRPHAWGPRPWASTSTSRRRPSSSRSSSSASSSRCAPRARPARPSSSSWGSGPRRRASCATASEMRCSRRTTSRWVTSSWSGRASGFPWTASWSTVARRSTRACSPARACPSRRRRATRSSAPPSTRRARSASRPPGWARTRRWPRSSGWSRRHRAARRPSSGSPTGWPPCSCRPSSSSPWSPSPSGWLRGRRGLHAGPHPPGGGAGHRLPLCAGARDADGRHGGHGQGRRDGHPLPEFSERWSAPTNSRSWCWTRPEPSPAGSPWSRRCWRGCPRRWRSVPGTRPRHGCSGWRPRPSAAASTRWRRRW